jgi:hypothetical protein
VVSVKRRHGRRAPFIFFFLVIVFASTPWAVCVQPPGVVRVGNRQRFFLHRQLRLDLSQVFVRVVELVLQQIN